MQNRKTHMYRTDFWTLWEKARVGCFEKTACILSKVKQSTSPGGMHETCSGLVHWEDPEGSGREGAVRGHQDGEYM